MIKAIRSDAIGLSPERRKELWELYCRALHADPLDPGPDEAAWETLWRNETQGALWEMRNDQGDLKGFALGFKQPGDWWLMQALAVDPQEQSQGMGSQLLEKMLDEARESGCSRMRCGVREMAPRARAFYKARGAAIDARTFEAFGDLMRWASWKIKAKEGLSKSLLARALSLKR